MSLLHIRGDGCCAVGSQLLIQAGGKFAIIRSTFPVSRGGERDASGTGGGGVGGGPPIHSGCDKFVTALSTFTLSRMTLVG